jgi:hypothetical protein
VREVPDLATTEFNQQSMQQSMVQDSSALRQDIATQKVIIDALTTLLIEKDFFTRDELAKIIEQKKMGL